MAHFSAQQVQERKKAIISTIIRLPVRNNTLFIGSGECFTHLYSEPQFTTLIKHVYLETKRN